MSTAARTLSTNVTGVVRLLPDWAWAIVFLALAVFWPQICEATFGTDLLDASINSLA
jgi:hypothetical protein